MGNYENIQIIGYDVCFIFLMTVGCDKGNVGLDKFLC